ncbi:MAG: hypothetical protein NZO58_11285, partial [Gemmataceae bacterium]|nr:hypothetical protein [Gemmataceae bacterium]
MKSITPALACLFLCAFASAQPPSFVKPPTTVRAGGQTRIEFTVSRPVDVAITIEDAGGKIVRHLAAGVLGKNPPAPLQADTLAQSVPWDGNDDWGKPATGGPFKAHVQLGLSARFDRFLGYDPHGSGPVSAVAVGPGGTVYVFHRDATVNGNMGGTKLKVYDRDGRHLKVLVPYPADIAYARVKALGSFQTDTGELVPRIHNWETLSYYPDHIGVRGRDMPEYSSPAVDTKGRVYWLVKGPCLVAVDADGGIPYPDFLGPKLLGDIKELRLAGETYHFGTDLPSLAISSDEQHVYFAGLFVGHGDWTTARPLACVFRVDVARRGPAEVFVGTLDPRPGQEPVLRAPRGLAVAKGKLYVADPGANRVVIFREADRAVVGQFAVANPHCIGVSPRDGAIYVCAYTGPQTADLIRFDEVKVDQRWSAKEAYRIKLPRTGMSPNAGQHRIAVDASTKPVRIWMPGVYGSPHRLQCFDDLGDRFVDRGDPRPLLPSPAAEMSQGSIEAPRDITIDRVHGEVYIQGNGYKTYRIDEATAKVTKVIDLAKLHPGTVLASQLVPSFDGDLYVFTWTSGLWRLDREGRPKNWDGLDSPKIPIAGMMNFQMRYLALKPYAPTDEVYLIANADYLTKNPMDAGRFLTLNAIGRDGKTRRTLIWQCLNGAIPRLDVQGNIYLADLVKPPGRSYPEFFDGKLPPPPNQVGGGDLFWYSYMYGSILKFPPSGGVIWHEAKLPKSAVGEPPAALLAQPKVPFKRHFAYQPHLTGEVQGALWIRFGYAPYSAHMSGNTSHCMCEGSGFDVDPFGRVFYPNLGQFRVE